MKEQLSSNLKQLCSNGAVQLTEAIKLIKIDLPQTVIPAISIHTPKVDYDDSKDLITIGFIVSSCGKDSKLSLQFSPESKKYLELSLSVTSSKGLTLVDILPILSKILDGEACASFSKKINSIELTSLKMNITKDKGFSFESSIVFLDMAGNLTLSVIKQKADEHPMMSFNFITKEQLQCKSLSTIFNDILGLKALDANVISNLPKMKFGVQNLKLDQIEKQFLLSGVIASSNYDSIQNLGYQAEGSLKISWQDSTQIEFDIDANKAPISLSEVEIDFPKSLHLFDKIKTVVPSSISNKLKLTTFHKANLFIDTAKDKERINIKGTANLFGEIKASSTFEIFRKDNETYTKIFADISSSPISLKRLPKTIGLVAESDKPDWLTYMPNVAIGLDEFNFNQKEKEFDFQGLIKIKETSIKTGFNLKKDEQNIKTTLLFEQEVTPISLVDLLNVVIPKTAISPLPSNLDLTLQTLKLDIDTKPVSFSGAAKGTINLLGNELLLSAKSSDSNADWEFSMETNSSGINLIALAKKLLNLQKIQLPINLDNAVVKIDTCTLSTAGTFKLIAKAKSAISISSQPGLTVELGVNIDKISKNENLTGNFNGTLIYKGITFTTNIDLNADNKSITATAKSLNLTQIAKQLTGVDLPSGIPDITIETLTFYIDSNKNITIKGNVSGNWNMPIGGRQVKLTKTIFNFKKDETGISCFVNLEGAMNFRANFTLKKGQQNINTVFLFNQSTNPLSLIDLVNTVLPNSSIPSLPSSLDVSLNTLKLDIDTHPVGFSGNAAGTILNKQLSLSASSVDSKTPWIFSLKSSAEGIKLIPLAKDLLNLQKIQLPINLDNAVVKIDTCTLSTAGTFKLIAKAKSAISISSQPELTVELGVNIDKISKNENLTGNFNGTLIYKGITFTTNIDLNADNKSITATAKSLNLTQIAKQLTGVDLPSGIPDITIETLTFYIDSNKNITVKGSVSGNWNMPIGDVRIDLKEANFEFKKDETGISCSINLEGSGQLSTDFNFPKAQFLFEYDSNGWKLGGELAAEVMGRYLNFKAGVTKVNTSAETTVELKANFAALVQPHYFKGKPDDTEKLFKILQEVGCIKENGNSWLLKDKTKADTLTEQRFLPFQKNMVLKELKKIQTGNALHLPNIITDSNLATFTLKNTSINLQLTNGKLGNFSLKGTSDFTIWNPLESKEEIVNIKNGVLSFEKNEGEKALTFTATEAHWKPLANIPNMPSAIGNGLIAGLGKLAIKKEGKEWSLEANTHLQIEEKALEGFPAAPLLLDLFRSPEDKTLRKIKGKMVVSSNGIDLNLKNEAIALTPNPSKIIEDALQLMIDAVEKIQNQTQEIKTFIDLLKLLRDELPDTGKAYLCLREINTNLSNNPTFSVKMGFGLPEKLNDLIFDSIPNNPPILATLKKLKGIVRTYDSNDLDNSIMNATLVLTEDGLSGDLTNFPPINWNKVSDLIKEISADLSKILENGFTLITKNKENKKITDDGIATEAIESIVIDFDGLTGKPKDTYGALAIDIPKVALSFKTGSFAISGGCRVESEQLSIPLPFQGICDVLGLPQVKEYLPEKIPVRSVSFIDDNGVLSLSDLETYLKDTLPEKLKKPNELAKIDLLLQPLRDVVHSLGTNLVNKLPEKLKEYLGIYLPKGFKFDLEITADQSVNFALEVDSPGYEVTATNLNRLNHLPSEVLNKIATLEKDKDGKIVYENRPALRRALRRVLKSKDWDKYHVEILRKLTKGDFQDALQILMLDVNMGTIIGHRVRRFAFGTALFNQVFRVDYSGEIDVFPIADLIGGLLLPDYEEDENKPMHYILPNQSRFRKSILMDKLVVFIIYQVGFPIPIPVYARELDVNSINLLGDETQMRWATELNTGLLSMLKKAASFKNFFTDKSSWLPLQSYPLGSNTAAPELGISLGPNYVKLPGILGYEHDGKNQNKQKIALGSKSALDINLFDLIGLSGNALKALILQKKVGASTTNKGVAPMEYLIQYLPINDRVGEKHIKLFHIFDLSARWLLTTSQEFEDGAWKRLNTAQTKDELLSIVPQSSTASDKEGFVAFFQGGLNIANVAYFDTAFVMAASNKDFGVGFRMKGSLGDVFSSELKGEMVITPKNKAQPFAIQGSGNLLFCGKEILTGKVSIDKDALKLSGNLDLFPDKNIPIDISGYVDGLFKKDTFNFQGGVSCRFGRFHLFDSSLIISNKEFTIRSTFLQQTIVLAIQQKQGSIRFFATMTPIRIPHIIEITDATGQKGPEFFVEYKKLNYTAPKQTAAQLQVAQTGSYNPWVTSSKDDTGWQTTDNTEWQIVGSTPSKSSTPVTINNPFFSSPSLDAWTPGNDQFKIYLSGRAKLLGMESSTMLCFTDSGFSVDLEGKFLSLFSSSLKVKGVSLKQNLWNGDGSWQGNENWESTNKLDWHKGMDITFNGKININNLIELQSWGGISFNTSGIQSFNINGTLDITPLNNKIREFFGFDTVKQKVNAKINSLGGNEQTLKNIRDIDLVKLRKARYIQDMDKEFGASIGRTGVSGYSYCVPPNHHVKYWSNRRQFYPPYELYYSSNDVVRVARYWQYKSDLGLSTAEPPRKDLKREIIDPLVNFVINVGENISTEIINSLKNVVNDLHKVFSGAFNFLGIDTSNLDKLNADLNKGLNKLTELNKKFYQFITDLQNNPLFLIEEISIASNANLSLNDFKAANTFKTKTKVKVLGQSHDITLDLNLTNPVNTIKERIKVHLPVEVRKIL